MRQSATQAFSPVVRNGTPTPSPAEFPKP